MTKKVVLMFAIAFALVSCKDNSGKTTTNQEQADSVKSNVKDTTALSNDYSGDYVTEEYNKKNEGLDWLVVSAKYLTDSTMHFTVRSRADKKKPTCSFKGDGVKINEGVYRAKEGSNTILFTFKGNNVTVSGEGKRDDESNLHWYCSGGASLSGYIFTKISGPLDETQLINNK